MIDVDNIPETLAEASWTEYEARRDKAGNFSTDAAVQYQAQQHRRAVAHNVRRTMARLKERGWPGRWPVAMLVTHKGWE